MLEKPQYLTILGAFYQNKEGDKYSRKIRFVTLTYLRSSNLMQKIKKIDNEPMFENRWTVRQ